MRKTTKAALAGAAAVAVAAGGSTFAQLSDWDTIQDNTLGTGIMKIDLSNRNGTAVTPLSFGNFNPGKSFIQTVYVASSDGASVDKGTLSMTVKNIRDYENGCGSTNSEAAVDATCVNSSAGDGQLGGEASQALKTDMYAWKAPSSLECGQYPDGAATTSLWHSVGFPSTLDVTKDIGVVEKGQGYCVRIEQYMPGSTGNQVQGDSMKFDLKFDLVQKMS